jgi:hypothetical protein
MAALALALGGSNARSGSDSDANLGWGAYAHALLTAQLVWAPPGNGIDTFRTWEAILAGAVPVVLTSALDPAYAGLGVLSVRNFSSAIEAPLRAAASAAARAGPRPIDAMSPLFAFHWLRLIEAAAEGNGYGAVADTAPFIVVASSGEAPPDCGYRRAPWYVEGVHLPLASLVAVLGGLVFAAIAFAAANGSCAVSRALPSQPPLYK